jgi:transposase-like protein
MAKHERDLRKERRWRGVLKRQGTSGLNVRAFCRREGIAESAFHFWRRTIREWRRTIREQDGEVELASRAPRFVPAIIASDVAIEAFTLELAGGHVLRMPKISVDELADLIATLARRLPR